MFKLCRRPVVTFICAVDVEARMMIVFICFLLVGAVSGRWVKMDSQNIPDDFEKGCISFSGGRLVTKCRVFESNFQTQSGKFSFKAREGCPERIPRLQFNSVNTVTFQKNSVKTGDYLVVHSNGVVDTSSSPKPDIAVEPFNTDGNVLVIISGGCDWEVTDGYPVVEVADTPPPPAPTPAPTAAPPPTLTAAPITAPTAAPQPLTCEKPKYSKQVPESSPNPRQKRGLPKVNRLLGDLSKWPKLISPKLQAERGILKKKNNSSRSAMSLALMLFSFLIHAMP